MAQFVNVFIAVMGMTGSGKSTLIKKLTGKEVRVGHGLQSCTESVEAYYFQHGNYIVHLVDTPGFDDTTKSDTETLAEVAMWLAATYQSQIRLTGILYLHKITDNRLGGCALQNLKMFKKMCGPSCLPNVVLLTTMWGGSAEQLALQESREQELKTSDAFWAGLIRLGAKARRHDNTAECALPVIEDMLRRPQIVLDIQRQIVDEGKNLDETTAGQQLREDIAKAEEAFKEQLREAKEEYEEALKEKDEGLAEEMKKVKEVLEKKLSQLDSDKKTLEDNLQKQLQQYQLIIEASNRNFKYALVGGVAAGLVTGGLGLLAGLALAEGTAAVGVASLANFPVGKIAGELGRRALMSATRVAVKVGTEVFEKVGPHLTGKAIEAIARTV